VDHSVEVRYAGVVVGRGAVVKDLGPEAAFVGIPEPLPVGTLVTLKIGDVIRQARVDEVVESAEPATAGMRVGWGGAAVAPRPTAATPPAAERAPVGPPAVEAAAPGPAPPEPARRQPPEKTPDVVAEAGPSAAEPSSVAADAGPPLAVGAGGERIPAPLSLAGPAGDGSRQGGGKRRRKRR